MVKELHENPKAFVAGEFLVKITVCLFSLGETAKFFCRLFHEVNISLAAALSERI
jgi:hypothetical protein